MYGFFVDVCGMKISVVKYSCISELKRKLQITHTSVSITTARLSHS